jgi:hypothetical protein
MGPRVGFWITLALVLFYLIARPHVGTVWHLRTDGERRGQKWMVHHLDVAVFAAPAQREFLDSAACAKAASEYSSENDVTGVYCTSKNALLWGW